MTDVLFPEVRVSLTGEDGNAFAIIGRCSEKARRAGVPREKIKEFQKEATLGDYNNLLQTCMKWFDVI